MSRSAREQAILREMGVPWPREIEQRTREIRAPSIQTPVEEIPILAGPSADAPPAPIGSAKGSDVSALDWPALQADVAACDRCGLCRTRRQTVFGVGDPKARWMVVGEAPGEQEDLQGEPFVGPAGQLLDRMLAAIGLTRGPGVFITNTVKCRPPQNRNPQPEELAACAPVLWRQIELVQPRIVLAMGRFAAQQLLATEQAIGRLRGQVHRLPAHPEVPVVVTYHPAYLLRNPADKGKAWADLCLAADTVEAQGGSAVARPLNQSS